MIFLYMFFLFLILIIIRFKFSLKVHILFNNYNNKGFKFSENRIKVYIFKVIKIYDVNIDFIDKTFLKMLKKEKQFIINIDKLLKDKENGIQIKKIDIEIIHSTEDAILNAYLNLILNTFTVALINRYSNIFKSSDIRYNFNFNFNNNKKTYIDSIIIINNVKTIVVILKNILKRWYKKYGASNRKFNANSND